LGFQKPFPLQDRLTLFVPSKDKTTRQEGEPPSHFVETETKKKGETLLAIEKETKLDEEAPRPIEIKRNRRAEEPSNDRREEYTLLTVFNETFNVLYWYGEY